MSKFKYYSYPLAVLLGAGLAAYFGPKPTDRVEYKDRIQTKVEVRTRVVRVEVPGGGSTTTTEIVDTGSSTRDTSLVALKLVQKQYVVGVGVGYDWGHLQVPDYSVTLGRRVLGPLLGAVTVSKERAQLSVLLEF